MREFKQLETADDVIDALGGNRAVEALTDSSPQTVSNWRNFGRFPSNMFVRMTAALAKQGLSAPVSLWRQMEPASS